MPEARAVAVQFSEAIEYLRRKLNLSSEEWRAIWTEAGGISAEVANRQATAMSRDLLKAVLDAIENGGTLEDFRKEYARIVEEAGWSYHGNTGWHSQMVFRLHTQSAYAAGRWEQAERIAELNPQTQYYWRYITVGDHRVRPAHRAWQGIILPRDHIFWRTHFPPNGFNCRCHVQLVTERDIRRYGWTVTPENDPRLSVPPDNGWLGNVGIAGTRLKQIEAVPARSPASAS